jgi:hypothetical protein
MSSLPKHRTLIIGDSHARGCAERLSDHLGHSFSVTGYVKPNADVETITTTTKSECENMTNNDVIILCGGTRNIGRNETSKGLHCISKFVRNNSHTKVMIMEAPHRFVVPTSCVNKEVVAFNRRLQKIVKNFNHAEIVNMSTRREHFTRHGLHMNGSGKDWITGLIATQIMQIFATGELKHPITLPWKAENTGEDREERRVEKGGNNPSQESWLNSELAGNNNQCDITSVSDSVTSTGNKDHEGGGNELNQRTSKRTKKNTMARCGDFLWT